MRKRWLLFDYFSMVFWNNTRFLLQLDALLSLKKKMTVKDLKTFLPFSINLDPYIKKVIKEEYQISEEHGNNYPVIWIKSRTLGKKWKKSRAELDTSSSIDDD
jgi:hypothetical protein